MKSNAVPEHGTSDRIIGQAKKPWVTPSLDVIALKSAEQGTTPARVDGNGGHSGRVRS
jgi:hypothetical protein